MKLFCKDGLRRGRKEGGRERGRGGKRERHTHAGKMNFHEKVVQCHRNAELLNTWSIISEKMHIQCVSSSGMVHAGIWRGQVKELKINIRTQMSNIRRGHGSPCVSQRSDGAPFVAELTTAALMPSWLYIQETNRHAHPGMHSITRRIRYIRGVEMVKEEQLRWTSPESPNWMRVVAAL